MKDATTRNILAYYWSVILSTFVGYCLYKFGEQKEVLMLLIGFITGTIGTILAVYFSANHNPQQGEPGNTTANISATITKTDATE